MSGAAGEAGLRLRDALLAARARIEEAGKSAPPGSADTPYLDALVLLAEATGQPKEKLLASPDQPLSSDAAVRFETLVAGRCAGKPVSYLLGRKEFYGRTFAVNESTLVPRPETELLVELALSLVDSAGRNRGGPGPADGPLHIHDACTGSGCVAITIKAERPESLVTASDISPPAVETARLNATTILGNEAPRIEVADGLEAIPLLVRDGLPPPVIVTANPPYLTDNEYGALSARQWPEPRLALEAGPDGLSVIRRIAARATRVLSPGAWLLIEIGATQSGQVGEIFYRAGLTDIAVHQDLAGLDRVCVARLRNEW